MNSHRFAAAACVAAAIVLAGTVAPAFADEDEIVVIAPYHVSPQRGLPGGSVEDRATLSRAVSTAGLDLTYAPHVTELNRRISDTARGICRDLERNARGTSGTLTRDCVSNAVNRAQPQVSAAIALAQERKA